MRRKERGWGNGLGGSLTEINIKELVPDSPCSVTISAADNVSVNEKLHGIVPVNESVSRTKTVVAGNFLIPLENSQGLGRWIL